MSAATGSSFGARSFISNLPEMPAGRLYQVADSIYRHRSTITDVLKGSKFGLRNGISSSQIFATLKKAGIFVEIVHIKCLLREFGYNFNGVACSFLDLFS